MYQRMFTKTKDGDSARSLAKIYQSEAIVLHVPSKISTLFCNFRFYIYGGYQMLKGMMSDFYCIDLNDSV
jgi:hypothetical protein